LGAAAGETEAPAGEPAPEPEAEPEPEPEPEPDPDLAEQVSRGRQPWEVIPGLLLDLLYLLPLGILTLSAATGEAVGEAAPLLSVGVLMGWTGALGAFLLALRRQRRGELRAPLWWGAAALAFPWTTYLTILTRREFAAGEDQDPRSFPVGGTVLCAAGALVFATGAYHGLLDPLLGRIQELGLGGLEAARTHADTLGRYAAEARVAALETLGQDDGVLGTLANGAHHLSALALVSSVAAYAWETVGNLAWVFALPVLLPAGLVLLLPGLWRGTQVADKLAGFGSRLLVFALAFHFFAPLAGAAAYGLTPFMPGGEGLFDAARAAAQGDGQSASAAGADLRTRGLFLFAFAVLVPLVVLWALGRGLRRAGRPLKRIHPDPKAAADEGPDADPE
jgi:hypothetical protein